MRKTFFFAPAALIGFASKAEAQDLNWYGLNACFSNIQMASSSATNANNVVSGGNCGNNSSSSFSFDQSDQSSRSSMTFTRSSPPGGPGDQGSGDPVSLDFGAVNSSVLLTLGNLRFVYKNRNLV